MFQVDGINAVTLNDIAKASGFTVESLRKRQKRGTLRLQPIATIGATHFYSEADLRKILREAL